jgi:hypothetical protein
VAHQFLHHLDIFPVSFEQRGVRVPEGVESERCRPTSHPCNRGEQSLCYAKAPEPVRPYDRPCNRTDRRSRLSRLAWPQALPRHGSQASCPDIQIPARDVLLAAPRPACPSHSLTMALHYGRRASAALTFLHWELGTPARFAPPVIIELWSQKRSTPFPPIRVSPLAGFTSSVDALTTTTPP